MHEIKRQVWTCKLCGKQYAMEGTTHRIPHVVTVYKNRIIREEFIHREVCRNCARTIAQHLLHMFDAGRYALQKMEEEIRNERGDNKN